MYKAKINRYFMLTFFLNMALHGEEHQSNITDPENNNERSALSSGCCSNTFNTAETTEISSATPNILPVINGGTGLGSIAKYAILIGNNTSPLGVQLPGAAGQAFISNGVGASPSFGTIGIAGGGTGQNSLTLYGVLIGNGTNPIHVTAAGTAGQALIGTSSYPEFGIVQPVGGGTGLASLTENCLLVGNGTDPILLTNTGSTGDALVSQGGALPPTFTTLPVAGGGTGRTSCTTNGVLYGNNTTALGVTGAGTTGQALISGGGAIAPTFGTVAVSGGGTGRTTLTAFSVLVGNGTGIVTLVSPGSTANRIFVSAGASADPLYKQLNISIQKFTASGTYTPSSGMIACFIECIGGGGAGGGCSNATSLIGSGGGSGGYSAYGFTNTDIGTSQAVTIGAGGTGTTGVGNPGGTTSVGALITAQGGLGGGAGATTAVAGGAGGTTSGSTNPTLPGNNGGSTTGATAFAGLLSGAGASSIFGQGGMAVPLVDGGAINGRAGLAVGSGGSGATSGISTTATATGGAGAAGFVMITEYRMN